MPDVVQSFWLGARLPALQLLSLRSFLAQGHDYHLYAFEPIENVPDGVTMLDAASILPRDSVFTYQRGFGRGSSSAFSNLFRYKLLYERGGWWVDTDVVCLRPFDFDADFVFATERDPERRQTVASCVIKSPANADYLKYCLDSCGSRDKSTIEWGEIGPRLVSDAVTRFNLDRFLLPPEAFNPIDYSLFSEIQAAGFEMARLSESFAVHLWNQKWKTHCLDPNYDGAPDSLYAWLRRRYLSSTGPVDLMADFQAHVQFQRSCIDDLCKERDDFQFSAEASARSAAELHRVVAELHEDGRLAREKFLAVQEEARRLRGELGTLRNSLSWRLTRPLRTVYAALMGARYRQNAIK